MPVADEGDRQQHGGDQEQPDGFGGINSMTRVGGWSFRVSWRRVGVRCGAFTIVSERRMASQIAGRKIARVFAVDQTTLHADIVPPCQRRNAFEILLA